MLEYFSMKIKKSYTIKKNKAERLTGKSGNFRGKVLFVLIFVLALGIGLYTLLVPRGSRPSVEVIPDTAISHTLFEYPDRFSMQSEFLDQFTVRRYVIREGDTMHGIMGKLNLPTEFLFELQRDSAHYSRLHAIHPGDELSIRIHAGEQSPVKLMVAPVNGNPYILRKVDGQWKCYEDRSPTYTIVASIGGTITGNLYDSSIRAGLPANLIMALADLFAYDIDFNTDLREGDAFAVHFREEVSNGKRIRCGPILAAEMEVSGKPYTAFYHESSEGRGDYYDMQGNSLRKMFLKAPLSYSRISSTFTHKRFHPVLKIYRPHFGIDYAAPKGTPVSALGSGTVTFKGWKGGYGNFVEIRHDSTYTTTYGHLDGYADRLRKGSRVQQGQIIGYVGATGLATGPHLDFRFYKNGTPIDFLKTEFPNARSVPKGELASFKRNRDQYLAALRGENRLASKKVVTSSSYD